MTVKRLGHLKNPVRKKPCPYCGTRLQAPTKHIWRNNLARHLSRTCLPFQRDHIAQMLRITEALLNLYAEELADSASESPDQLVPLKLNDAELKRVAEIGRLERLYALEAKPKA